METMLDFILRRIDTITSIFVHISIVAATIAGAIKFKLLQLLSSRYKSHLECRHHVLSKGQILFEAEYTVSNIGELPIDFSGVSLLLCAADFHDGLLSPSPKACFAERVMDRNTQPDADALFHIAAGERSIFTLRTILTNLDPIIFVLCRLTWEEEKGPPAPYIHLYVRADDAISQHSLGEATP